MGTGTYTKAADVARYFLALAAAEDESDPISPMRLQKLLYYVQGWSLARRGMPMFKDKIEAWPYGPVVEDVYHAFKEYGRNAIPEEEASAEGLDAEEKDFVGRVWNVYKPFSAISLSNMTHSERPWKDARGNLPKGAQCSREITKAALKAFFTELDHGKEGRRPKATSGR